MFCPSPLNYGRRCDAETEETDLELLPSIIVVMVLERCIHPCFIFECDERDAWAKDTHAIYSQLIFIHGAGAIQDV